MGKKYELDGAIPTLDLQESPFPYAKLREACENWGCFRVLNHNVPVSTMSEMKTLSRSLLDLPIEVKNRNTYSDARGYIPLGSVNSIYESLGIAHTSCPGAVETFCSQLDVSSNQREIIEKYRQAVSDLVDDILDKIATSVGLSEKHLFKDWSWGIRMNKYNFTSETVGSYGVNPHTDPGFLTVLQDDEIVGGLEVADPYGSTVTVNPSPGNFVINLGDLAVAWSNGRFGSVKHSVLGKEVSVRVSIGAFVAGPEGLAVEAPEELVDEQNLRVYGPLLYGEYMALRTNNNMHKGEALSLLRVQS